MHTHKIRGACRDTQKVVPVFALQLLRRWRAMVGATAHHFKKAELNQLHLVEVALRLEAPGIGATGVAEAQWGLNLL
jgi:hypothetical protein